MIARDKTFIYFKEDLVPNAKANVLVVHGIAEHLHRYDEVVKELNKSGYNVFRFDHRGHGRSGGPRGYLKSIDLTLGDIQEVLQHVRKLNNLKIFLLGHSLGGGIVNIYASTIGDIDGYISSGAATNNVKQLNIFKVIPYQIFRKVTIKNKFADGSLSSIKEVEEAYTNDPYVIKKYKLGYLGEVMLKGAKRLKKNYHNIKMPVLILHGKLDPIVPVEFSKNLFNKIASDDKELVIYENSYHEIYNDIERIDVINKTIEWLDKHV